MSAPSDAAVEAARQKLLIDGCLTCHGARDYQQMLANLTDTQARCTELLLETRAQREELAALRTELAEAVALKDAFVHELQLASTGGLLLPGWWCPCEATDTSPGILNGAGRELRATCRACGAAKP